MAELIIKKFQCDRCQCILDDRPNNVKSGVYSLVATEEFDFAGGRVINWKELCRDCNSDVSKIIDKLQSEIPPPYQPEEPNQ